MELLRALAALAEPPSSALAGVAEALDIGPLPEAAEYTDLFVLQLPPYASIYVGAEGMLGGEARDRVAGFWRALGLSPPPEPDHVTTLLASYAQLVAHEQASADGLDPVAARARQSFFWEHVASWLPVWLAAVDDTGAPFYRRWALLLQVALTDQALEIGAPDRLSLHLREAPPLVDPRDEGGAPFVAALLAPVRSGIVLTRSDLRIAAGDLDVGVRLVDRTSALSALLADQPSAALEWLATHAERWAVRHAGRPAFGTVSEFWAARASATAALLRALRAEA